MMLHMQRNFARWDWSEPDAAGWKCSECGAPATAATHVGPMGERQGPYNLNQETCSSACADARKVRLQRERRAEKREEKQRRQAAEAATEKKRAGGRGRAGDRAASGRRHRGL
jgi:hypothetical protein